MAVSSSSAPTAVVKGPRKKSSAASVCVVPSARRRSMRASSSVMKAGSSAEGSAWTRLPPKVPRIRI